MSVVGGTLSALATSALGEPARESLWSLTVPSWSSVDPSIDGVGEIGDRDRLDTLLGIVVAVAVAVVVVDSLLSV